MVNKCKFFNTYLICIQSTLVDKEENKTDSIMFNYFQLLLFISFLFFPFFFFFGLFRAAPAAYGSSQSRD